MPWFSKKKASPLDSPDWQKLTAANARAHVEKHLNSLRAQWEKKIKSFNIPVPTQATELKVDDTLHYEHNPKILVTLPTFKLPPHLIFRIQPLTKESWNHKTDKIRSYLTYFIAADQQTLSKVRKVFNTHGLHEVVNRYKGVWCTVDPYGLYKYLHQKSSISFEKMSHLLVSFDPFIETLASVNILDRSLNLPIARLEQMHERAQFYYHLHSSSGTINPTRDQLQLDQDMVFKGVPDPVLSSLPLPDTQLADDYITLKLYPPPDSKPAYAASLLQNIRTHQQPAIFSLIAEHDVIYFQLSFDPKYRATVERGLETLYPGLTVLEIPNVYHSPAPLHTQWAEPKSAFASYKTLRDFHPDPYATLLASLSVAGPDTFASLSIFFAPVPTATLERAVFPNSNIPFPESLGNLAKKLPVWLVAAQLASNDPNLLGILRTSFHTQYADAEAHWQFSGIRELEKFDQKIPAWNMLSTDELAALVHFPGKDVSCDRLETASMKAKLPPDLYTQEGVIIGKSTARGQTKTVTIPDSVRDRHAYVVGKSGTGKSTLLFNAIRQDIERGHGVAVIDPHGDLVEEVLQYIPQNRIEDTIYFNAADKAHPIGLNILNAQTEDEIGLLADDLLITFKRLSESWGERMENILRYSFHTLLRCEDATFLDIKTLLQNPDFRLQAVAAVHNRMLQDFWQLEYPNYPKDAAQPILNRMSKFSLSPTLVGILGQPDSTLNFFDVIQNKKILLVNISKGQIGEDTAQLLGSLIVSQLQLAIMRRAALPKESRDPYYLYVDEFQNFTTSAFEKILSEARKYKLCLTLAHQYISQLDDKTKNAILANVGTIVMFQSYPQDAQALRPELGQYEPTDVTNLNTAAHEALCKPSTQSKDTFLFQTLAPPPKQESFAREIIEYTRENYATTPIQYDAPKVVHSPTPKTEAPAPRIARPARALPKEFANTGDKILHYVSQAEWLATPQIHELCYSHIAEGSRAPNASRDLKALVEGKRIKFQNFGKSKIYYTGRQVNPTTHNLAIRDLFSKIVASNYELAEVNFFPQLPGLTPDLAASFLSEDGSLIKTFWEYDAGTEGIAELLKKVSRYDALAKDALVIFVFNSRDRLVQFAKAAGNTRIALAVLSEFTTLDDSAFVFLQKGEAASEASGLFSNE